MLPLLLGAAAALCASGAWTVYGIGRSVHTGSNYMQCFELLFVSIRRVFEVLNELPPAKWPSAFPFKLILYLRLLVYLCFDRTDWLLSYSYTFLTENVKLPSYEYVMSFCPRFPSYMYFPKWSLDPFNQLLMGMIITVIVIICSHKWGAPQNQVDKTQQKY